MKKIYRYLIAGLGMLIFGTTIHANAASTSSPSLSLPELEVGQKSLSGEATKGTTVTVRANNAKKTKIASAVASKTTGKYTIKLPKSYAAYTKLYVYAQTNGSNNYFYRILTIKPKGTYSKGNTSNINFNSNSATASNDNTPSSTSHTGTTVNSKFTLQTPTGTWQSNSLNGIYNQYIFSQKNGLSEINYNGHQSKTLVKNASYQVIPHNNVFWEIKYREHGQSKFTSLYFHFNTNNQFYLTNEKDQVVSASDDNTFNLVK